MEIEMSIKFGKLELNDWVQDQIGNWYRKTNLILPVVFNPPPAPDIFVTVWKPKYDCILHAPWFKLEQMQKIYEKEFLPMKFTSSDSDLELVKLHVDNFIIRMSRLIVFL
jgi:hypothetical protein